MLFAGLLMLASAWLPLIRVRFTSPQYPTDQPTLSVYTDRIAGNTHEFEVLSHYVGISFPPKVPELDAGYVTWIIAGMGILALLSSMLSPRLRKISASLLLLAVVLLAAWAQFRFYQCGHNLDPEAPMRTAVKPFTPPLFGWIKIHRIVIYHIPHVGSFLIFAATAALIVTFRRSSRVAR